MIATVAIDCMARAASTSFFISVHRVTRPELIQLVLSQARQGSTIRQRIEIRVAWFVEVASCSLGSDSFADTRRGCTACRSSATKIRLNRNPLRDLSRRIGREGDGYNVELLRLVGG